LNKDVKSWNFKTYTDGSKPEKFRDVFMLSAITAGAIDENVVAVDLGPSMEVLKDKEVISELDRKLKGAIDVEEDPETLEYKLPDAVYEVDQVLVDTGVAGKAKLKLAYTILEDAAFAEANLPEEQAPSITYSYIDVDSFKKNILKLLQENVDTSKIEKDAYLDVDMMVDKLASSMAKLRDDQVTYDAEMYARRYASYQYLNTDKIKATEDFNAFEKAMKSTVAEAYKTREIQLSPEQRQVGRHQMTISFEGSKSEIADHSVQK